MATNCTLDTLFTGYSAKTEGDPDIIFFYEMVGASDDAARQSSSGSEFRRRIGLKRGWIGLVASLSLGLLVGSNNCLLSCPTASRVESTAC